MSGIDLGNIKHRILFIIITVIIVILLVYLMIFIKNNDRDTKYVMSEWLKSGLIDEDDFIDINKRYVDKAHNWFQSNSRVLSDVYYDIINAINSINSNPIVNTKNTKNTLSDPSELVKHQPEEKKEHLKEHLMLQPMMRSMLRTGTYTAKQLSVAFSSRVGELVLKLSENQINSDKKNDVIKQTSIWDIIDNAYPNTPDNAFSFRDVINIFCINRFWSRKEILDLGKYISNDLKRKNEKYRFNRLLTSSKQENIKYLIYNRDFIKEAMQTNIFRTIDRNPESFNALYAFDMYNIQSPTIVSSYNPDEIIRRLGLFLAYYDNKNNIDHNIPEIPEDLEMNQSKFKEFLKRTLSLGCNIVRDFITSPSIKNHDKLKLYNEMVDRILLVGSDKHHKAYPYGYDWFLFSHYYHFIINTKIFINYKMGIPNEVSLFKELKYFTPSPNHSKHIKRSGSNTAIISMNYFITKFLLSLTNEYVQKNFVNRLNNFLESDDYRNHVIIRYKQPSEHFDDGLYIDGGFIVHKNFVSYNYLILYLLPSLFFNFVLGIKDDNISRIFNAISCFRYKNRPVNPNIVSRYGTFHEIKKNSKDFAYIIEKIEWEEMAKITETPLPKLGVIFKDSASIVVANFPEWSTQLRLPSELAIGEVDIYNIDKLLAISMNKIMFQDHMLEKKISENNLYPGVISPRKQLKNPKKIEIKKGTQTFTYDYVKTMHIQPDLNHFIYHSHVKLKLFGLEYKEFVVIMPEGLLVGYFDIVYKDDDDLMTVVSNKMTEKLDHKIHYSDNSEPIEHLDGCLIKKIQNNIFYSNTITNSNPNISVNTDGNDIIVNIKSYTITIKEDNLIFIQNSSEQ